MEMTLVLTRNNQRINVLIHEGLDFDGGIGLRKTGSGQ